MNSTFSSFEKPDGLSVSGSECSHISSITILSLYRVISDPRDFTLPKRSQPSCIASAPALPICTPNGSHIDNQNTISQRSSDAFHTPPVDQKEDVCSPSTKAAQSKKKGTWTKEEDARLLEAMKRIPTDLKYWETVASYVGTRSSRQCKWHWNNVLDPQIKLPTELYG